MHHPSPPHLIQPPSPHFHPTPPLCPLVSDPSAPPSLCIAESIQMSNVGRSGTMYQHFMFTTPRSKLDCVACQREDGLILGLRAFSCPYCMYQAFLAWLYKPHAACITLYYMSPYCPYCMYQTQI